ncbi:hypothetical protein J0X14_04985 [Muricauda sp. CAU 1633]|uniref:hypothetical protein n=1 Tax=Allomuricauda sp. CAU 1633 TaxID=2816036 RepID=UPI001A8C0A93|nr:hypothetical protein [Muricauda sp. CAU 1633]MBO0321641.1 hypothetical protein [Muricauda sp. CAU 1633]
MSKLIDALAYPIPPAPFVDSKDTVIPQRIADSLLNVKMDVGIHPNMYGDFDSSTINLLPDTYKDIMNSNKTNAKIITDIKGIESLRGHHIELVDATQTNELTGFYNVDILFHFSVIIYNSDKTKAVLELGTSKGMLNGSSGILCMEKRNDEWTIVESFGTSIW